MILKDNYYYIIKPMYYEILKDYSAGILDSIRINLLVKFIKTNGQMRNCIFKIFKFNFFLHLFPFFVISLLEYLFNISLVIILNIINYPINIFSIIFHIIHYMELISIICKYSPRMPNDRDTIDTLSLSITMTIYQLVIYFSATIINYIIPDKYYFNILLTFIILTFYHSFYCFNSLWQYKLIKMSLRIDMHDKLWPYYAGYGTIATIIYHYIDHPIILSIYNTYIIAIILLPFLLVTRYPRTRMVYPSINLSLFSYMMRIALYPFTNLLRR